MRKKLTKQVCVKFTKDDYKRIKKAAKEKNNTVSEEIRLATLQELKIFEEKFQYVANSLEQQHV